MVLTRHPWTGDSDSSPTEGLRDLCFLCWWPYPWEWPQRPSHRPRLTQRELRPQQGLGWSSTCPRSQNSLTFCLPPCMSVSRAEWVASLAGRA